MKRKTWKDAPDALKGFYYDSDPYATDVAECWAEGYNACIDDLAASEFVRVPFAVEDLQVINAYLGYSGWSERIDAVKDKVWAALLEVQA